MCGFVGWKTFDGKHVDEKIIRTMADSISHRGPDDEGFFLSDDSSLAFGFRRLAILDLTSAGHQPMHSPDGRLTIVFNGEIYNYIELRAELETLGHSFRSRGDTEVLLEAYREWGPSCLEKLNGMWAFLVYDKVTQMIFGARDRFWEKPLYYYRRRNEILFASEIKAILKSRIYVFTPNWEVLSSFTLLNDYAATDAGSETFFSEIEQIPAGCMFSVRADGLMTISKYWELDAVKETEIDSTSERFAELFEHSVKLRLRSDVRSGVLLSGGLDSTSILCAIHKLLASSGSTANRIDAFSYFAADYDESKYIAETIDWTGANLHRSELATGPDFEDLPRLLWFYDQPVHSTSPIVGFELTRLAREAGVIVLLNGQGADETLGGYSSYFPQRWHSELLAGRVFTAFSEIAAYAKKMIAAYFHLR